METAVINYADVVADLRFRATRLNEAASILESLMGEEEKGISNAAPAPVSTAAPKKKRKSRNFEEFLDRKRPKAGVSTTDNRPALTSTVLQAITEGPKSSSDLTARVLQLRPGTNPAEIPKTAYFWKQRGKIEKRLGQWCLAGREADPAEPVAATERKREASATPAKKETSIRDLIREAIARGQSPTMEDVVERVQRVMPNCPAPNIKTAVGQLIIGGEAKQTFGGVIEALNLKLPAAVNGAAH